MKEDFVKYIKKIIDKNEIIEIRIKGEQRQGMSTAALSLTHHFNNSFIKQIKKDNKESERRILINEREVNKVHRDFLDAI